MPTRVFLRRGTEHAYARHKCPESLWPVSLQPAFGRQLDGTEDVVHWSLVGHADKPGAFIVTGLCEACGNTVDREFEWLPVGVEPLRISRQAALARP